jgi:hypothetical protein
MINFSNLETAVKRWGDSKPFPHIFVDDFFSMDTARQLEIEFPDINSSCWFEYNSQIEIKKTCNNWGVFPPHTYKIISLLMEKKFTTFLSETLLGGVPLYADMGLHGAGWHIHGSGGKLNTHLDYSIHPKLNLQRKLNLIVYLNSNWKPSWGGSLGLWGNDSDKNPGKLIKTIDSIFNRAVLFDTTQNSWHGLPEPITSPPGELRKSLAIYYLIDPPSYVNSRGRALFAPADNQVHDPEIAKLIKERALSFPPDM